jgi:hypothetical protein
MRAICLSLKFCQFGSKKYDSGGSGEFLFHFFLPEAAAAKSTMLFLSFPSSGLSAARTRRLWPSSRRNPLTRRGRGRRRGRCHRHQKKRHEQVQDSQGKKEKPLERFQTDAPEFYLQKLWALYFLFAPSSLTSKQTFATSSSDLSDYFVSRETSDSVEEDNPF